MTNTKPRSEAEVPTVQSGRARATSTNFVASSDTGAGRDRQRWMFFSCSNWRWHARFPTVIASPLPLFSAGVFNDTRHARSIWSLPYFSWHRVLLQRRT